jgi:hypothetical protein
MWHPTARLRWIRIFPHAEDGVCFVNVPNTLQQLWIRMDSNPEIAEGVPYEGAREWRDVPTEEASS